MSQSPSAQKATDGPRLVGAVAALWLDYVHDLIVYVREIRQEWSVDQWASICDRIEDNLKHLERTAMPIPDLTMEELIELGKEMLQAELVAKEQGEHLEESYREALADTQAYLQTDKEGKPLERCPMCGDRPDSEKHRVTCLCSACGYPLNSDEHTAHCKEEKPDEEQASDRVGEPVPTEEGKVETRQGYCNKCGHHGATNAHRDACLQGKRRTPGAENLRCKKCGHHIRSRVHRENCAREVEKAVEPSAPQEGGAVKCKRCGGNTYLEGDGDIVCLQCGDRVVGEQFGAAAAKVPA